MQQLMPKNAIITGGRLIEIEAAAALSRVRNFRAAAAELGLSPTAFSRAIQSLEDRLGVQLFARTTRSVAPTPEGERFLACAQPALRDLHLAVTQAQEGRDPPHGTLRLTSSAGAARQILEPVLLAFLARYPDMRIDLVTEPRLIDVVAEAFDAGIRTGGATPRDMVKIPFGLPMRSAVVATPAVIRAHGAPQTPQELMRRPCIPFRRADGTIYGWEFRRGAKNTTLDVPGSLILNDPSLAHQAALAGAGYAYLGRWSVEKDIATGRLESVLEAWLPAEPGLCLYHPKSRHPTAGLRALIGFLETHQISRPAGSRQNHDDDPL